MASTTIKVPVELRDRLAEIARAGHTTLAGAIERSLAAADDACFWDEVAATLGADRQHATDESERLASALSDGLDQDEDWTDVL